MPTGSTRARTVRREGEPAPTEQRSLAFAGSLLATTRRPGAISLAAVGRLLHPPAAGRPPGQAVFDHVAPADDRQRGVGAADRARRGGDRALADPRRRHRAVARLLGVLAHVPRINILRSLVARSRPGHRPAAGSTGEAVSRFRDDARDIAQILDVWLDLIAAIVTPLAAFIVLLTIDAYAASGHGGAGGRRAVDRSRARPPPPAVAVGRAPAHRRGHRLHRRHVRRHHRREGRRRRAGGRRPLRPPRRAPGPGRPPRPGRHPAPPDPVGHHGQRRPRPRPPVHRAAIRRGDVNVGDVALFTTYSTVLAALPASPAATRPGTGKPTSPSSAWAACCPSASRCGPRARHDVPPRRSARAGARGPGVTGPSGGAGSPRTAAIDGLESASTRPPCSTASTSTSAGRVRGRRPARSVRASPSCSAPCSASSPVTAARSAGTAR